MERWPAPSSARLLAHFARPLPSLSLLLPLLVLLLGGCAGEGPTTLARETPGSETGGPSAGGVTGGGAAAPDLANRFIVRWSKGASGARGVETAVESRGGVVLLSHPIGVAVVAGLSDAEAEDLRGAKGITDVAPDAIFDLEPRLAGGGPETGSDLLVRAGPFTLAPAAPAFSQALLAGSWTASAGEPSVAEYFPWQWNLRAVHADEAWARGRVGSPDVTLAILDSGIDYLYPDLVGRVDLSRSVSFVAADDDSVAMYFPDRHPVTDLNYHGTHVAATAVSNGLVAAGVTSRTTLMGVKVCDASGNCPFGSVVFGLLYAADNGADVVNLSLGGSAARRDLKRYVGLISSVFNYLRSKGVTVVVSAGNEATDLDHDDNGYETYCSAPNVICVSATGPTSVDVPLYGPWVDVDAPAPYTNFGRSAVNVAAPGGTGSGVIWAACSTSSLVIPLCQTDIYVMSLEGTSMASAHVAGLAALLVEDVGRNPGQVKTLIQQTADDLGPPGTDPYYGKGRVNVIDALRG